MGAEGCPLPPAGEKAASARDRIRTCDLRLRRPNNISSKLNGINNLQKYSGSCQNSPNSPDATNRLYKILPSSSPKKGVHSGLSQF